MSDEVIYESDGKHIYVSITQTAAATGYLAGPDDGGTAGVREPLRPNDEPPSLAAEAKPDEG